MSDQLSLKREEISDFSIDVYIIDQFAAAIRREQMIDEAVRRTTHDTERRVLVADFNICGEWPPFNRHVLTRIRTAFNLMAAA